MKLVRNIEYLNWIIGAYIIGSFFFAISKVELLFLILPIFMLFWQIIVIRIRVKTMTSFKCFYESIESGDYWRLALIILFPLRNIGFKYIWGFNFFALVVAITFIFLLLIVILEFINNREITSLSIGCLIFMFFLLWYGKPVYVRHHGVPEIGHFFEKKKYNTLHPVEISKKATEYCRIYKECMVSVKGFPISNNGNNEQVEEWSKGFIECFELAFKGRDAIPEGTTQVLADISVSNTVEYYDGDDGDGGIATFSEKYREIWVHGIYLSEGVLVQVVDQDEEKELNSPFCIKDENGDFWGIQIPKKN